MGKREKEMRVEISRVVGNGEYTSFWFGRWAGSLLCVRTSVGYLKKVYK